MLDKLYLTGTSQIFTLVALGAAEKFDVSLNTVHLDSSSFHLHGEYESDLPEVIFSSQEVNSDEPNRSVGNQRVAPVPIKITYGYSRDHRPDLKQFILDKAHQEAKKNLRKLAAQEFACKPDALAAATRLSKQLKYHNLTQIQIVQVLPESEANSSNSSESSQQVCKIQAQLEPDTGVIVKQTRAAGRFILATNVLDINQLSCDEMIAKYKEQPSCERGLAFLKDPLFFTDSVFLKSPERIEALALVMGLCLLVYSLGQRYLHSQLRQAKSTLKNQLGQLTISPTLRWIFQCFQSVHFLQVATIKQIFNLTQERLDILKIFPASCRDYYLLMST